MGYDRGLIRYLEAKSDADARMYRCPFVDAIRGRREYKAQGYHPIEDKVLDASSEILDTTYDIEGSIGDTVRGMVVAPLDHFKSECGEEPAGSWHQQKNGGRRYWLAVSGEFDAR